MKVVWLINITMPDASMALGKPAGVIGGWLTGYRDALLKADPTIELHVIAPYWGGSPTSVNTFYNLTKNNSDAKRVKIQHHLFPQYWLKLTPDLDTRQGPQLMAVSNLMSAHFAELYETIEPDVVHLHGTELPHALTWIEANGAEHTVASIQGLASEYAKVYMSGLSRQQQRPTLSDWRHGLSLFKENEQLRLRGAAEISLLKRIEHVAGRTTWDHDCTLDINPMLYYHQLQEVLREEFYTASGQWFPERCQSHTIFVSQSHYPIKGLHRLLEALPKVITQYPDVQVRIVGKDLSAKHWWQRSTYGNVLYRLIEQNGLRSHLTFLGPLDAEQMVNENLRANVFVCPSRIENSCNSVCEAQMIGTPVVAANVGGMATLIESGVNGLLYDFDDTDTLASHICQLFANTDQAIAISEAASRAAIQRHDRNEIANTLLYIYRNI